MWPSLARVRWDRFFEDLEDQLDSEWEAERAALDTEAERLRVARMTLHERLLALSVEAGEVLVELAGHGPVRGCVVAVGPDWLAVDAAGGHGAVLIPSVAVDSLGSAHDAILRSARGARPRPLQERMTFGFVLRDLVRRRVPVHVDLRSGGTLPGTIDRAASDHLDLALHEAGVPRRSDLVLGHRIVPFTAIAGVRPASFTAPL